jgi:alkylation response protein AidB-like acyl-CoA dehydrogenase
MAELPVDLFVLEGDVLDRISRTSLSTVGLQVQGFADLTFAGVSVDEGSRLTSSGSGAAALASIEPQALLSSAVAALAAMRRGLTWTLEYVSERKAFGTPLIQFQNTQFEIGELLTSLTVAQAYVDLCVGQHVTGGLTTQAAAMAKLWCSEIHANSIDRCLQLHGGYGYMHEYPIARAFRDASATRLYWGSSEALKQKIAESLGFLTAAR